MLSNLVRAAALAVGIGLALPSYAEYLQVTGFATVVDGDTIKINGLRIRLFGIDAPEGTQYCLHSDGTHWQCAQDATHALEHYIARRPVVCVQRDVDRYRRLVCQCAVAGEDINAWLVRNGWAVAFTRYSREYIEQERQARAERRGIWSGDFVMPWDWRRGQRFD